MDTIFEADYYMTVENMTQFEKTKRGIWGIFLVLLILLSLLSRTPQLLAAGNTTRIAIYAVIVVVCIILYAAMPHIMAAVSVAQYKKRYELPQNIHSRYCFTEDEFYILSDGDKRQGGWSYDRIKKIVTTGSIYFLILDDGSLIVEEARFVKGSFETFKDFIMKKAPDAEINYRRK